MVSTPEAMAQQIADAGVTAQDVDRVEFFHSFFRSPDRIEYWLRHPSPPGEDAAAVARRIVAFAASLLDAPAERPRRFVCVTHSPVMRAVLARYLDHDPGEPEWVERIDLTVRPSGTTIAFRQLSSSVQP
jgi:broad specificity phosphatase PhoE